MERTTDMTVSVMPSPENESPQTHFYVKPPTTPLSPQGGLCTIESPSDTIFQPDLNIVNQLNSIDRIVGWHALKNFLQPLHPYFADSQCYIKEYSAYYLPHQHRCLLYPKVCGPPGQHLPRKNPYRNYQLARSHTARRVALLSNFVEVFHLKNFAVTFLTVSFPKELSIYLSENKGGIDYAWSIFRKFWTWYDAEYGPGLACVANLHTWRSANPLEPHFHVHILITNYRCVTTLSAGEDGEDAYNFVQQTWHIQRGGILVPLSETQMGTIKLALHHIYTKFCSRHRIVLASSSVWANDSTKLDIYIRFAAFGHNAGRSQILHWFNYQGRSPLEDYCIYSNAHPDCPNPPNFITSYTNHSRAFGFWKFLSTMISTKKTEMTKIHPYTLEPLLYHGKVTSHWLAHQRHVGFLDMVMGKPVFHILNANEVNWLMRVTISDNPLPPPILAPHPFLDKRGSISV